MNLQDAATKLNGLLELQRKIVGVKLVRSKAEFDHYTALELSKPLHYCVAVKSAMAGHSLKLTRETAGCPGGSRALGLAEPPAQFFDGTNGRKMGLYKNETTAAGVAAAVPICPPSAYGVIIKPLEFFEHDPDVVLIAAVPRTIMRVLQGYTYNFGLPSGMHMSGNQAVCVECTATPFKTHGINVSMMCSGTRFRAGWKNTEAMVGLAFEKLAGTVKGIEYTVNPVESDQRKKQIAANLGKANKLDIEVEYGRTYYQNKPE